jgi:polar amino acid transport system substrate-binding protein
MKVIRDLFISLIKNCHSVTTNLFNLRIRNLTASLTVLALVVGLTACGSSADTVPSATDATGAQGKNYLITSDTAYAPFEFNQDTVAEGIDVDVIKAISEIEGFTYSIKYVGFDAAIQAVASGQADGVIAGMSITDPRKVTYDFSNPYYKSGSAIAVEEGASFKNFTDLKGKSVGAKKATTSFEWLTENADKYGWTVKAYDDAPAMYDALLNAHSVEGVMDDAPIIEYAIKNGDKKVQLLEEDIVSSGELGFAVQKGINPELLAAFNDGLEKIIANGQYDQILQKYGAVSGAIDATDTTGAQN